MRNTVTTGISLAAGLLLLAGCSGGGQTGQAAQDTTDTGTSAPSSTSGVSLPERTAPAKSLDLADPCTIITKQQQNNLGASQPPEKTSINEKIGCKYQKGDSGAKDGWFVFISVDPKRTAEEFVSKRPTGQEINISGYPAYKLKNFPNCQIVVDIANSGSLFINGGIRFQESRPDPCPIFTEFAETAVENLSEA
ncbi:DUF3558 domain-containing protein [Actinopolyspora erythraea]|uniref:DUF3558 domain-containing protein n=1 Tax=Actinopolyspora erythraea TaxID=414996 RepID=A0A223RS84_9ACTN|nr:DUF3558 domain-containing protein [Actinopolyspora erythraea]ASU78711.1 DUF3558 domain-containing protein [Actinopolyspora erythraea]